MYVCMYVCMYVDMFVISDPGANLLLNFSDGTCAHSCTCDVRLFIDALSLAHFDLGDNLGCRGC